MLRINKILFGVASLYLGLTGLCRAEEAITTTQALPNGFTTRETASRQASVDALIASKNESIQLAQTTVQTGIPEQFQDEYSAVEGSIDDFTKFIQGLPQTGGNLTFGAELITANAHRASQLLTDEGWRSNLIMLDALHAMGVEGVTVQAGFGLFSPDNPNYSKYVDFYSKLAGEIKSRGMTLHAKTGFRFTSGTYSDEPFDYSHMTKAEYLAAAGKEAVLVAKIMSPDYMTILNEPWTVDQMTPFTLTPGDFVAYVSHVAKFIAPSTQLGAGAGTWDLPVYTDALLKVKGLDFLDIHIYSVNEISGVNQLERAYAMGVQAKSRGKNVIVGEFWADKTTRAATWGESEGVVTRNAYDIWEPLDKKMLFAVTEMARKLGFSYVSPFNSKYFFGYVPYNESTQDLNPRQLQDSSNVYSAKGLIAGTQTSLGDTYSELIKRDHLLDQKVRRGPLSVFEARYWARQLLRYRAQLAMKEDSASWTSEIAGVK